MESYHFSLEISDAMLRIRFSLSYVSSLCYEIDSPNIFIVGEFNACPKNFFVNFHPNSAWNMNWKCQITYASSWFFHLLYVSDTRGTCSWLDHLVAIKSAHHSIQNIEILHQFILVDHRPVSATTSVRRGGHCAMAPTSDTKNKKNYEQYVYV